MKEKELESINVMTDSSIGLENSQSTSHTDEPIFSDIMEDFSNAVIAPSETMTFPKEDEHDIDSSQSLDLAEDPVLELAGGHVPEVPVLEVLDGDAMEIQEEENHSIGDESIVNEQDDLEKKEERKIMKNNWTFILTLFAIVGAFVLLLPILVRLIGY